MLQQFLRKEREDKAPMIAGNYTTSQKVDLFDSSHLTKVSNQNGFSDIKLIQLNST